MPWLAAMSTMPEAHIANHPHHLAPPGRTDATANHNVTTLDTESVDNQSVRSNSNGNINDTRPARRYRDRLKDALGLGNGVLPKAGPMYSETFEQISRPREELCYCPPPSLTHTVTKSILTPKGMAKLPLCKTAIPTS